MGSIVTTTTMMTSTTRDNDPIANNSQDSNRQRHQDFSTQDQELSSQTQSQPASPYWWQQHQPPNALTNDCPSFLQNLSAKDIGILSTPDSLYQTLTWSRVQSIVASNRLDLFQRQPSQLYRYLEFNANLKKEWGSVIRFVLERRLGWGVEGGLVVEGKGKRFEDPGMVKILWNDWPYGIDDRIVHLVVWTKFILEDDETTGDLRDDVRAEIQNFVNATFGEKVGSENVIWFKNWKSLKSVHAVEHFHVMLFDPDLKFVDQVTGGDVPLSKKVQRSGQGEER